MGLICDCLYRLSHHQTKIEKLEKNILEYEEFMEQLFTTNSCCYNDSNSYNRNKYKSYMDR